jgi:hypothetical protein
MRKAVGLISLVLVLLSLLSGCGGTKQATTKPATSEKSSSTGPGTYTASFGEVQITLTLPATDDAIVQAIKAFTSKVEALKPSSQTPVALASFTVKNGSSSPTRCEMYTFSLTFNSGSQVDGKQASEYVGNIQDAIPDSDDSGLYNEGVNLYNQLIEPTDIMPGTSRTSYCVFQIGDLAGLKKVFASQYSGGTKEMKKQ